MADVEISYKGAQIASMSASGVKTLLTGDSFCEDDIVVSYTKPSTQSKTVSPSTSQQTVSPDPGFLLSSVTVNAMPSGTAGIPSATKSSVANHSVTVTPSVTNTTGYITGGTLTGTPASVSASELVSGTLSITDNGTGIDVTNYAAVDVDVSGGGMVTITVQSTSQGLEKWKIPSIGSIERDPDSPWITTITAPANSMIVSFNGWENPFVSVSGLTYETVTVNAQRDVVYNYVFYLGTTNGTITC